MGKIEFVDVSNQVLNQNGFDERGCYGSTSNDPCCTMGADVNTDSYELIISHKEVFEQKLGRKLEDCFEKGWSNQPDFLGSHSISTTIINGLCVPHLSGGTDCVLFQTAIANNSLKRIIPSACRLYPITWNEGVVS